MKIMVQVRQVRGSGLSELGNADRPSGTDRLTSLSTEIQLEIMRYLIPNRGRIAVSYDYYGPNTSGIKSGSLNILRVSKHLSKVALHILYGYRWFRISSWRFYSFDVDILATRWHVLYNNIDQAHSIHSPLECFEMLLFHTPAHLYLTRLEVMIDTYMRDALIDGRLLKALQHAKGLRELELFMRESALEIMPFVHKLGHIRSIKVFSWSGKDVLYEAEVANRNKNWVQPPQAVETI